MQRWGVILLAACAIGAAGCGDDDDSPTTPSNQPLVFTANLSSANEVPAVSNAETGANGTATITLTPTRDASNAITGGTFRFQWTVRGLTNTSNVTLSHIHRGAAGANGGVVVDSLLSAATSIPTPAGTASFERDNLSSAATIPAEIVANPSAFYFNVHTSLNPGGVVRGQLAAQ